MKHIIFCLIIFSNTCFGKEFNELFVIYEPIESVSQIEKSINNSFNSMIYREENLYEDRSIKDYISEDALRMLLESERIKSIIRDFEQDMWNN